MRKFVALFAILLATNFVFAQTEISSFNATGSAYSTSALTDYQCLGINPANLGWSRNQHTMNIGFFEFAGSIYTEALTRSEVVNDLFASDFTLDSEGKKDAADKFTDARMMGIGGVMALGFSYQDEKIGGFAFNIRERMYWNSLLNDNGADYLFLGWNDPYFDSIAYNVEGDTVAGYSTNPGMASSIYEGSEQNFYAYMEYNLGYGRKLYENDKFKVFAGIGLKYLVGYGMTQYYQDDNGELVAFSALSPMFGVDFDEPTPSEITEDGIRKTGSGFGFDIGTTFEVIEKLRISLAVNDIGSIKWNGNVYKGNDGSVWEIETAGLDNYNIFEQGELIVTDNKPNEPDTWEGLAEQKMNLPMNLRGGASYRFNEMVEVGGDVYVPLRDHVPGQYEKAIFGVGCKYDPAKWVQISLGVMSGGEFGTNVPLGFLFYPIKQDKNTWEIGFSTRDVVSFFAKNSPTVSIAMGFLRFSFGSKEDATRYLEEDE